MLLRFRWCLIYGVLLVEKSADRKKITNYAMFLEVVGVLREDIEANVGIG
jgi:hypothetical protein